MTLSNHIQQLQIDVLSKKLHCYKAEPVARVGLDINQDGEGNPVLMTRSLDIYDGP